MSRQFHVVLSYSTLADNPAEALKMAISRVDDRDGFFVEIYPESAPETEVEGDISEFLL